MAKVELINILETATFLDELGEQLMDDVEDALEAGGKRVVYQSRDLLRAQGVTGTFLPHYFRAITSETDRYATHIDLVVGPESGLPQGGMGPGVELGSVNTGPKPHLYKAFDDRVDGILDQVARVAVHGT
jgi:hypothetical protein